MKKIAIATLHYGFNEGAILQAYALSQLIEKHISNAKAEILDHRYTSKMEAYGPPENARQKILQQAIENWLPLSPKSFYSSSATESLSFAKENYDVIFVGSDVVWNLKYKRRLRRFFPKGILPSQPFAFFPAFPNIYWPDSSIVIPRVSYASSIGTLEYNQIPKAHLKRMRQILEGFSALGVRDERTLRFLEYVNPKLEQRASLVPDPTLGIELVDDTLEEKLKDKLVRSGIDFGRPRCAVICDDHPEIYKVACSLRGRGFQVVGITAKNSYSDIELFEYGFHPMEWAILFRFFNLCITERMHGAIFCLKNFTPFIALDINETKYDNDSKTASLMRRFDLSSYSVSKNKENSEQILEKIDALENNLENWNRKVKSGLEACEMDVKKFFNNLDL